MPSDRENEQPIPVLLDVNMLKDALATLPSKARKQAIYSLDDFASGASWMLDECIGAVSQDQLFQLIDQPIEDLLSSEEDHGFIILKDPKDLDRVKAGKLPKNGRIFKCTDPKIRKTLEDFFKYLNPPGARLVNLSEIE